MSRPSHDTEKSVPESRARVIPGRNGGTLTPFQPGQGQQTGYRKPHSYAETLHLARKSSPEAMRTLIRCLNDPDSRTAVVAAERILERAWGRVREMAVQQQEQQPQIDLTGLTQAELKILFDLAMSGRLRAMPTEEPDKSPPMIEAKPADEQRLD